MFLKPRVIKCLTYSFFSNVVLSVENTLCIHNVLDTVGVASTNSNNFTANYISRHIIGDTLSCVYLFRKRKSVDENPYKSLLKFSSFYHISSWVECTLPIINIPNTIPILGLTNTSKAISMIGMGAINVKIIKHLSCRDDVAELYTVFTIANTVATTVGHLLGIYLLYMIPDQNTRLFLLPFLSISRVLLIQAYLASSGIPK